MREEGTVVSGLMRNFRELIGVLFIQETFLNFLPSSLSQRKSGMTVVTGP